MLAGFNSTLNHQITRILREFAT